MGFRVSIGHNSLIIIIIIIIITTTIIIIIIIIVIIMIIMIIIIIIIIIIPCCNSSMKVKTYQPKAGSNLNNLPGRNFIIKSGTYVSHTPHPTDVQGLKIGCCPHVHLSADRDQRSSSHIRSDV